MQISTRIKQRILFLGLFSLILLAYFIKYNFNFSLFFCGQNNNPKHRLELRHKYSQEFKELTRDFFYYECKDRRRIGGPLRNNDKLARIDGAWYVCFDGNLAPVKNQCNVLSFGINTDESFDYEINRVYECNVHSFDPYIESERFKKIRESNSKLKEAFIIEVNKKWKFYRMGLTGKNVKNKNKLGWIATLEEILVLVRLKNKIVDIFKMDIEWTERGILIGGEIDVLENFNIDYACKYFKQFLLETHSPNARSDVLIRLLRKLEKCFSLFFRDTRLIAPGFGGEVFNNAAHSGYRLNLGLFSNEVSLVNFLISTGELYFINENFL